MKRFLYTMGRKTSAWMLQIVAMATLSVPATSSEALFRDVSENNERIASAIGELNAYYAESPGFKYAKAVLIDTAFLESKAIHLSKRARTYGLPAPIRHPKFQDERVLEWEGMIPESRAEIALRRIKGKFYGSYHDKQSYRLITPYRSGGEWMTMMLVFDGLDSHAQNCGMDMRAGKYAEEIEP